MIDTELVAQVYVSWGIWVARCPRDGCLGAEHYGHAPITGAVGGLTDEGFECNRCGLVCRSDWPANAADIWFLLSQRPLAETRSWELGESLENLVMENAQHGLVTPTEAGALTAQNRLARPDLLIAAPSGIRRADFEITPPPMPAGHARLAALQLLAIGA